ncbi:SAM-dependent methyltransferase [Arsenicitalea aurantiaca]|uniref:SAM-dependent methyltransferase n=1 Tax=Arsenicitalea aurantiaca TaxID=1783274 RepID=A0A433X5Z9_9HYPH|nr:SAM-dependent methyltransferase [Arsenicitalea aurantiaca]RUT29457.1 SAM-dependent methyltransferase [Arsenicitalea aurantiaca]
MTPATLPPAPTPIFDRARIARRIEASRFDENFVLRLVLADLEDRLSMVTRAFSRAVIVAPAVTGLPAQLHSAKGPIAFEHIATASGPAPMDGEAFALPGRNYDLIVSLLDLQWVTDVPGYLARTRAHLAPDGLFIAAFPGGDTLSELRQAFLLADSERHGGAFARVAPMIPLKDAAGLLQRAGFALPVADVETHIVRYADPLALFLELRALGASNPLLERPSMPVSRALLGRAAEAYRERAEDQDGRVRATLELVWLSGWSPHESQQKPLKPGSAEVSLSRVLGRPEG